MGDPLQHSQSSAKRFGGIADDYLHVHTVMDSSKLFLADWRHRALLHNTFGIHIFEQLMGSSFIRKSDGVAVCTRSVISQHIIEDLGAIPTAGEFLREMPLRYWMSGIKSKDKLRMQTLTIEGSDNKEAYVTASIRWTLNKNEQPINSGHYIVVLADHTDTFIMHYNAEEKVWSDAAMLNANILYWANLPISPLE